MNTANIIKSIPLVGTTALESMTFNRAGQQNTYVAPESKFIVFEDTFQVDTVLATAGNWTQIAATGSATVGGGLFASTGGYVVWKHALALQYSYCVLGMDIAAWGGGTTDTFQLGVRSDAGGHQNGFEVEYDWKNTTGYLRIFINDTPTAIVTTTGLTEAPAKLYLAISGRIASAFYIGATTGKMFYIGAMDVAATDLAWDLRLDATRALAFPYFAPNQNSGTFEATRFTHRFIGGIGFFNHRQIVRYKDGTPIIDGQGNHFVIGTLGMPSAGAGLIPALVLTVSVFAVNQKDNFAIKPENERARYIVSRNGANAYGAGMYADAVGCLTFDPDLQQWIFDVSTFGDLDQKGTDAGQAVKCVYYLISGDALNGVHVLSGSGTDLVLPSGNSVTPAINAGASRSVYDSSRLWFGGQWCFSYSEMNNTINAQNGNHPRYAVGTTIAGPTRVWADNTNAGEGCNIHVTGGVIRITTATAGSATLQIYGPLTSTPVGTVTFQFAPYVAAASIAPHLCIIPFQADDGYTDYYMLHSDGRKFNTAWTEGPMFVEKSTSRNQGWEFPLAVPALSVGITGNGLAFNLAS